MSHAGARILNTRWRQWPASPERTLPLTSTLRSLTPGRIFLLKLRDDVLSYLE